MEILDFRIFGTTAETFMFIGALLVFLGKNKKIQNIGEIFTVLGILTLASFIALLWMHLNRPPLRMLGETRMWYSFFISVIGYITLKRWKYRWFILYSNGLSILFINLNLLNPENFDKTLMPALQSYWFVPHVCVYIFAYALLGSSVLVAIYSLFRYYTKAFDKNLLNMADNLVYVGFAFLTLGLLFGAMWAKEAWGHYWTWDPKETWAFITWLSYLIYIHLRLHSPDKIITPLWLLSLAFVMLLIAWFGINYLPSASNSVHVYAKE